MIDSTSTLDTNSSSTDRINVLAIAGFVLAFPLSIVGAIVSIIALVQISRTAERGRSLAIAGTIIGAFWFVLFGVALLIHGIVGLH